jgi:hypothetical protein
MTNTDTAALPDGRLGIDPGEVAAAYAARGLDALSDEQLFAAVARVVAVPKLDPASSFVLHAPLELLARRALLRYVPPEQRVDVRRQLVRVAAQYEHAGEPAGDARDAAFDSPASARVVFADAIAAKDLDAVDAAAAWLGRHANADDVMALADAAVAGLAAAGHANIYFLLLARTAWASRPALALLRPLARELARYPELRIEWLDDARVGGVEGPGAGPRLAEALAGTPRLGLPGSDFVFPTVHQVDSGGQARALVEPHLPADLGVASAEIQRVAALSMLQDDPAFAPYGWSHCLTLSQAAIGIRTRLADPVAAAAIAATYVVAFRAAEGAHAIAVDWEPERPSVAPRDALDAEPAVAAGALYHASAHDLDALVPVLAARAGSHDDAHLAKYTLACFDAAAGDPPRRRLYLAAAAYLGAWWAQPR